MIRKRNLKKATFPGSEEKSGVLVTVGLAARGRFRSERCDEWRQPQGWIRRGENPEG
jgi:hypothetical protein